MSSASFACAILGRQRPCLQAEYTITVQLNIFSAKATFNFTSNNSATNDLKFPEVVSAQDGDDKSRDQSLSASNKTLVDEHEEVVAFKTINWLAGVGDICNGTSRETGEVNGIPKSYDNKHSIETRKNTKVITHRNVQGRPNTRRSALRRHCDFWDADQDGVIYPWDIFIGFRKLGFNIALCLWAAVTMAVCSSYSTQSSFLPHPLFAIYLDNVNRNRHGSTTGAYDLDAELDTRRFDAIFEKYAGGKDYLTGRDLYDVWAGQCCANDFFGWFAGALEWIAMYILLWPQDGRMHKHDIRGVYDGTIFWRIAESRSQRSRS